MAENLLRKRKHEEFFYVTERTSLEQVLVRLGKNLSDLPKAEVRDLLCLFYNLPYENRGDVNRVLASFHLAGQILSTVRRHEIGRHATDPSFREAALRIINGDPGGVTYEEVRGLRGLLDDLLLFAGRGY